MLPPRLSIRGVYRQSLAICSRPLQRHTPSLAGQAITRRSLSDIPPPPSQPPPPPISPLDADNQVPLSILRPKISTNVSKVNPEEADAETQAEAMRQLELMSKGLDPFRVGEHGHKFGMPTTGNGQQRRLQDRYEPILTQLTKLMMWDGKLAKAQRDMAMVLNILRTTPTPKVNPAKPLLPGSPPPSHLPLNPVLYLQLAVDSVAPLIRIQHVGGLAGGGRALPIPFPISVRQRRRTAFKWILESVNKKQSRGSGRARFPQRVADEIIAVVEGRSGVWDKRQAAHKLGTQSRANLAAIGKKGKRRLGR